MKKNDTNTTRIDALLEGRALARVLADRAEEIRGGERDRMGSKITSTQSGTDMRADTYQT